MVLSVDYHAKSQFSINNMLKLLPILEIEPINTVLITP